MSDKNVEILDSSLRDGAQGEGISFSVQDKIHICKALDELGVAFIEAGNPGSNPKDMEFFQEMKKVELKTSKLCAFGSTRRKDINCSEDVNLQSLLAADTEWVVIFGKSWTFQVTDIIKTTLEENLAMIRDTCKFLCDNGRQVIYDAEHFFTGYQENSEYAIKTLEAAVEGGAKVLSLCETKGGCMLKDCETAVAAVCKHFGDKVKVGIHTHNDCGLAVANSLVAVESGARHVQGTFLGFGERTGNANLSSIIPCLLKLATSILELYSLGLLQNIKKKRHL
jgi:2-isopropylmalate synthase